MLDIRMVQDEEQRGGQRQGGRGSATEGHSPESRLGQEGEIQARRLQSKGQDRDHLWPGTNPPKSDADKDSDEWVQLTHSRNGARVCLWGVLSLTTKKRKNKQMEYEYHN